MLAQVRRIVQRMLMHRATAARIIRAHRHARSSATAAHNVQQHRSRHQNGHEPA
jgi:hypothetical protein